MVIFIGPMYTWGPVYGSVCLSVRPSVRKRPFLNLSDLILADDDTNSILTKFQDFDQISGFQPNFRISTKFQDFDQILGF